MNNCGNCKHWNKHPTDPSNLTLRVGECRESLQVVAVPREVPGGVAWTLSPCYPVIPHDFPPCSHHETREPISLNFATGEIRGR